MSRKHQRPRAGAAQRLRGWLLLTAVACLLGQGAALAHLVLVQHATCVEHDALVHAGSGPAAQALPHATARTAVLDAQRLESGHEDDHCLAVSLRRREALTSAGAAIGPAPAPAGQSLHQPLMQERASSVPLLLLAPKSSPPIVLG